MDTLETLDTHCVLSEDNTLTFVRLLPGPVERVWAYITENALRRQWLAAGEMDMKLGAPVELIYRNDALNDPPGLRPEGFPEEQRMASRITALDPLRRLALAWDGSGDLSFELEPQGAAVRLTVVHRDLPAQFVPMFAAGLHMHLDILSARLGGRTPPVFWDGWRRLQAEYSRPGGHNLRQNTTTAE